MSILNFLKKGKNDSISKSGDIRIKSDKEYQLGSLKSLEEITIDEMIQYPIWVNDLSGEDHEDFDETSIRPLLDNKNITSELVNEFFEVSVLVKHVESGIFCSVIVQEDSRFSILSAWKDGQWVEPKKIFNMNKIDLLLFPSIDGVEGRSITYNINADQGILNASV